MPANKPSAADEFIGPLVSICGFDIRGDLGPYTTYTNKNGKAVFYPRAPPRVPPTQAQKRQRARFKLAQQSWQQQTADVKAEWEQLTHRAAIAMTGQNLWIALALNPADDNLANVAQAVGITIAPPPPIPI